MPSVKFFDGTHIILIQLDEDNEDTGLAISTCTADGNGNPTGGFINSTFDLYEMDDLDQLQSILSETVVQFLRGDLKVSDDQRI